jgi:hypothetical protein
LVREKSFHIDNDLVSNLTFVSTLPQQSQPSLADEALQLAAVISEKV